MLDALRGRMQKVGAVARGGAFAASVFHKTGFLAALSPSGIASFARAVRGVKPGPHLALLLHACNKPEKLAMVDARRRLSYGELNREINRLAHGLAELGVTSGERVALMLRNCSEYVIAQAALARLGGVAVQVGYRLKPKEISYILDNAKPRALILHKDYLAFAEEARAQSGGELPAANLIVVDAGPGALPAGRRLEDLLAGRDGDHLPSGADADGGGVMVYTSGTTGNPKGANRNFKQTGLAAVGDFMARVGMRHDDRHLVVCPLYHSAAPAFVAMMFSLGATVVIVDHFEPEPILDLIARERITCAFMVPTQIGRLAALDAGKRKKHDTSSLRWVCSGAAPLPTETARRFQDAFGPILWNFYGATETGLVTLAGPGDHLTRPGTIGQLLRGNEVRLLGEDGRQVPAGEVGELYARSPMLISGYHRNPEATAQAMIDGFFSVGDLGRVDADGHYYLADRKHDMVISGGVNIYPREIEEHLHTHPAVLDVAVIGVPDEDWGESLKAFVVLRPGTALTADEVRAYCQAALADYKRPRHVEFIAELPRNPTGKVLKRELRTR